MRKGHLILLGLFQCCVFPLPLASCRCQLSCPLPLLGLQGDRTGSPSTNTGNERDLLCLGREAGYKASLFSEQLHLLVLQKSQRFFNVLVLENKMK